jgi:hypothetical protein
VEKKETIADPAVYFGRKYSTRGKSFLDVFASLQNVIHYSILKE